jgi:hypothetical protein
MQNRDHNVNLQQEDRFGQLTFGRIGQKSWFAFNHLKPVDFQGFREAPVIQWRYVIKKHPVVSITVTDIWLQDQDTAIFLQDSPYFPESSPDVFPA